MSCEEWNTCGLVKTTRTLCRIVEALMLSQLHFNNIGFERGFECISSKYQKFFQKMLSYLSIITKYNNNVYKTVTTTKKIAIYWSIWPNFAFHIGVLTFLFHFWIRPSQRFSLVCFMLKGFVSIKIIHRSAKKIVLIVVEQLRIISEVTFSVESV